MRVSLEGLVSDIYEKVQDANDLNLLSQDNSSRSISIIKRYRSKPLERMNIIRGGILNASNNQTVVPQTSRASL